MLKYKFVFNLDSSTSTFIVLTISPDQSKSLHNN